jgi:hypothetical protein
MSTAIPKANSNSERRQWKPLERDREENDREDQIIN